MVLMVISFKRCLNYIISLPLRAGAVTYREQHLEIGGMSPIFENAEKMQVIKVITRQQLFLVKIITKLYKFNEVAYKQEKTKKLIG